MFKTQEKNEQFKGAVLFQSTITKFSYDHTTLNLLKLQLITVTDIITRPCLFLAFFF